MAARKSTAKTVKHKSVKTQRVAHANSVGERPADVARELIDMPEAIRLLKTTRPTFYRWVRSGAVKGMKVGRQWRFYREDIERFLKGQAPRIDLPADIGPLLKALRKRIEAAGSPAPSLEGFSELQQAAYLMAILGLVMRASDIHITSHMGRDSAQTVCVLRCRVDGVLQPIAEIDPRLLPAIVEEWKRMAACDVREKIKPQDGRIMLDMPARGRAEKGGVLDMRVSFLPASLGESLTIRILDKVSVLLNLARIDFAPPDRERLQRAIHAAWGVVLIAGPVGSGKTTVLYACLNELAGPSIKVMTIEDPVEYLLPWATQVQVNVAAGVTFTRAVRAFMRSDPDVIMVGEIRDPEMLGIAQQAAINGHLVMSTLHTTDAMSTLKRMIDMGSDPFLVADSTKLVLAQRLVRKLCPQCSVEDVPPASRLDMAAEAARKGGLNWHSLTRGFRKAVGCDQCLRTGYKHRTIIAETLEVTPEIAKALRSNASADELLRIAVSQGMTSMAADGIRRAAAGETSLDEVMRVAL